MNTHSKVLLIGAFICFIDALALLFFFDSIGGFLLGCFGFAVALMSSALLNKLEG